jgi:hypothetical protein
VLAIPLPAIGRVAHARVWRDATVGIYEPLQHLGEPPPLGGRRFLVQVAVEAAALRSARWPVVGRDPFARGADAWPAARFVADMLAPGRFQIYHRGALRDATVDEVRGLESAAVWSAEQLEERLVAMVRGEPVPHLCMPWPVPVIEAQG